MKKKVSCFLSNKIKCISVFLALLVIMIHAYNISNNTTNTKIIFLENFISQGISRIAVPIFFILSGYLFFKNYNNTKEGYKTKLSKKVKTLFIPYIIWNFIGYIIFLIPMVFPKLQQYINGYNKDISIIDFIQAIFLYKYNGSFWFMFYLIILNVCVPIIYYIIKNKKIFGIFIIIDLVLWFIIPNDNSIIIYNIVFSTLFFTIGAYISIHYFDLLNKRRILNNKKLLFLLILWILTIILYNLTNCDLLQKISISIGIIPFWELFSIIKFPKILYRYSEFTFIIYAVHPFILKPIQKVAKVVLGTKLSYLLLDYMFSPILTITIILCLFTAIKKVMPKAYKIISGNR